MGGPTWMAVLRDLALMGLGTSGMVREMFYRDTPSMQWIGLYLLMIAGTGAINAVWLVRNSSGVSQLP